MPPIRQAPTLILPGGNVIDDFRGPTAAPHDHVAHVTTRISIHSFFLLLTGTVVIFGLTILVWHLGSFFRRFTRARVIGEKKDGQTRRYAKTWHGWVDLERYEDRQRRKRKWVNRLWVWVGLRKPKGHGADVSSAEEGLADGTAVRNSSEKAPDASFAIDIDTMIRPIRGRVYRPTFSIGQEELDASIRRQSLPSKTFRALRRPLSAVGNDRSTSLRRTSQHKSLGDHSQQQQQQPPSPPIQPGMAPTFAAVRKHSQSMPSLVTEANSTSSIRAQSVKSHASESDQEALKCDTMAVIPRKRTVLSARGSRLHGMGASGAKRGRTASSFFALARQYQMLGAKMQLKPSERCPQLEGFAGRPGTPVPTALRAMLNLVKEGLTFDSSSGQDESVDLAPESGVYYRLPETFVKFPPSGSQSVLKQMEMVTTDIIMQSDGAKELIPAPQREDKGKGRAVTSTGGVPSCHQRSRSKRRRSSPDPNHIIRNHIKDLSREEVHLLFNLGKKLEWLCGELEPYRRPAQYLLIFNHWLNRKTWYVYDAPGRVPLPKRVEIDLKRKRRKTLVSSRHKEQQEKPASMTSQTTMCDHKTLDEHRLKSWRKAVNIARRFSGMETFHKEVEDVLKPVDPTPDGAIDPASWILRRPPQGQGSQPRGDTWFEGSGGVLETYDHWQRIGKFRGARVKRFLSHGMLFGGDIKLVLAGKRGGCAMKGENTKPNRRDNSSAHRSDAFQRVRRMSATRFKRMPSGAFRNRRNSSTLMREQTGGKTLVASQDIAISALMRRPGSSGNCGPVNETDENMIR